jgi:WD40 repeat protein
MGLLPSPSETSDPPPTTPARLLATGGYKSRSVCVWDVDTYDLMTELGVTGGVWGLVIYEVLGSWRLAVGSGDGSVRLFDAQTYGLVASSDHLSDRIIELKIWTDPATGAALLIALAWNGGGMVVRSKEKTWKHHPSCVHPSIALALSSPTAL